MALFGCNSIKKIEETDSRELVLNELTEEIKKLQDLGAQASDIAILVRKKEEAERIADRLLAEKEIAGPSYNFDVLSSESLYVKNSILVSFLLSVLELINTPDNELVIVFLNHVFYNRLLPRFHELGAEPNLKLHRAGQLLMDFSEQYTPSQSEQFEGSQDPNNEFIAFIQSEFFRQQISTKNLQELVFEVCNLFNLFELKEEQAYLQAFIDQIGTFMKSRPAEISAFLKWWEDQGHKKTIAVSEDVNAIRIQTVHKAKGLEYKYVFIPFCDWPTGIKSVQHAPILWCQPTIEPFNELELVPVRYETSMANSFFRKAYFEEKINSYIDSFNLLYVAFTRARSALFTWSVYEEGKLNSVGDLLNLAVTASESSPLSKAQLLIKPEDHFDSENEVFELGKLSILTDHSKKENQSVLLDHFKFRDFKEYLRLRRRSENYFSEEKQENKINLGKIIHEVLAAIKTADEVDSVVDQLIFQGIITSAIANDIRHQIKLMVNDPKISSWFNGTYRVINERSILSGDEGIKRPDRIMIGEDKLIVVDYKSGERELEKYQHQVKSYMRKLKACGYENITGYIWYTKPNKRIKVEFS